MRYSAFGFSLVALLVPTSFAQTAAPVVNCNPPGSQYIAVLPNSGPVTGSVVASSNSNGIGANFQVSISDLPSQGGPFRTLRGSSNAVRSSLTCKQYTTSM